MLEATPSRSHHVSRRRREFPARALSAWLLLMIFYGATCGLVHSHAVSIPTVATSATAFDDAHQADLTTQFLSSGKDCLLCQFHQQLSHGHFQTTPFTLQPSANAINQRAAAFNDYSAPHESSRGRAPPFANLL